MFAGQLNVATVSKIYGNGAPTLNNGNWTYTIAANTLDTNKNYNVYTNIPGQEGSTVNTVKINNTSVEVAAQTLTVSAN
jgi:hypothetical protein